MRRCTYYVNASLDGYIAGPADEIDVFPLPDDLLDLIREEYPETLPTHLREPLGVADVPNRRFDTVVMGRRTYQPALDLGITSPYDHLEQHVVSTTLPVGSPDVVVEPGDPVAALQRLKQADGGGIWLAGGGRLAAAVQQEIDELVIKRSPIVLGAGIPMFAGGFLSASYRPTDTVELASGYTVTTYVRA